MNDILTHTALAEVAMFCLWFVWIGWVQRRKGPINLMAQKEVTETDAQPAGEYAHPHAVRKKSLSDKPFAVLVVAMAIPVIVALAYSAAPKESELRREMGLTKKTEQLLLATFEECGIKEIVSVKKFQTGERSTSYHLHDIETQAYYATPIVVWMANDHYSIEAIYYNDYTICENDKAVSLISLYYISKDIRDTAKIASQVYVSQCLAVPSSAKYNSVWRFGYSSDELSIIVQSTVTCKSQIGIEGDLSFQVTFDRITAEVTSVIIDGKEYIQ